MKKILNFTLHPLTVISILLIILGAVIISNNIRDKKEKVKIQSVEQEAFIKGYIKGAYDAIKSDTLLLVFIKTYDLTPEQQGQMMDIYDMSRWSHSFIDDDIELPDLTLVAVN